MSLELSNLHISDRSKIFIGEAPTAEFTEAVNNFNSAEHGVTYGVNPDAVLNDRAIVEVSPHEARIINRNGSSTKADHESLRKLAKRPLSSVVVQENSETPDSRLAQTGVLEYSLGELAETGVFDIGSLTLSILDPKYRPFEIGPDEDRIELRDDLSFNGEITTTIDILRDWVQAQTEDKDTLSELQSQVTDFLVKGNIDPLKKKFVEAGVIGEHEVKSEKHNDQLANLFKQTLVERASAKTQLLLDSILEEKGDKYLALFALVNDSNFVRYGQAIQNELDTIDPSLVRDLDQFPQDLRKEILYNLKTVFNSSVDKAIGNTAEASANSILQALRHDSGNDEVLNLLRAWIDDPTDSSSEEKLKQLINSHTNTSVTLRGSDHHLLFSQTLNKLKTHIIQKDSQCIERFVEARDDLLSDSEAIPSLKSHLKTNKRNLTKDQEREICQEFFKQFSNTLGDLTEIGELLQYDYNQKILFDLLLERAKNIHLVGLEAGANLTERASIEPDLSSGGSAILKQRSLFSAARELVSAAREWANNNPVKTVGMSLAAPILGWQAGEAIADSFVPLNQNVVIAAPAIPVPNRDTGRTDEIHSLNAAVDTVILPPITQGTVPSQLVSCPTPLNLEAEGLGEIVEVSCIMPGNKETKTFRMPEDLLNAIKIDDINERSNFADWLYSGVLGNEVFTKGGNRENILLELTKAAREGSLTIKINPEVTTVIYDPEIGVLSFPASETTALRNPAIDGQRWMQQHNSLKTPAAKALMEITE